MTPLAFFSFAAGFFPPLSIAAAYASLAGLALCWALTRDRPFFRTPFDLPVMAFLGAWLLSSLCGLDAAASLSSFSSQLRFLAMYLLVWLPARTDRRTALKGYLWGAGAAVAYGLLQWCFTRFLVPEGAPGLAARVGVRWARYLTLQAGRAHGATHPLTYAETILPLLFFAAAGYLQADRGRDRLLSLAALLATGTALILSQSRGPWLGAAAGLLVLAVLHRRRVWLLLPAGVFAALLLAEPSSRARLSTLAAERRDDSQRARLVLWRNGQHVAARHLPFGVGPGMMKKATELHRGDPGFRPNPYGYENDLHNLYLHHLAERGLPGVAATLWLLGVPLWACRKALRADAAAGGKNRGELLALTAFFAAFPLLNFTERALDDAEAALVFWMLSAALLRFLREEPAPAAVAH